MHMLDSNKVVMPHQTCVGVSADDYVRLRLRNILITHIFNFHKTGVMHKQALLIQKSNPEITGERSCMLARP